MKIAILGSRGYPSTYGGFETFVRKLAPWLVERGHNVTVFGRGGNLGKTTVTDGVTVVDTVGLNGKSASTFTHGVTAALHCLRDKPDVVLMLNVANGPAILILKLRRIPVVINVDGLEWKRAKWGRIAKNAFRFGAWLSARFADAIVVDSKEVGRIWRRDYAVQSTFIPYGADVLCGLPTDRVQSLGLEPAHYALAVARLAPENNVELFLDAMEILQWSVPTVVVGSANYRNPLQVRLGALRDARKVLWLGHIDDQALLAELWANAGVYFHGHSVGGTNPALLSALGLGAPTIAVETPYNEEVLGARGLVSPDPVQLAAAVQNLVGDRTRRAEWAEAGRERVAQAYRWDDVLIQYEKILSATTSKRECPRRATADCPESGLPAHDS